ncbi:MAG: helix-turn-helix domain-containing protein, partial [Fibrobacteraceae bacterium]
MSEVNSVEDKAPEETLGAYLTRAREMRGLSQEMLSQKTHISITILENIESGDWKKFPIEAYVRGYLNSISESLNLDSAKILSYFSKEYGSSYPKVFVADPESNLQKSFSSVHERTPSSKNTKWIMIVLVVLALAFLAIMNFVKRAEVSTPSSGDSISVALPVEDSSTEFTAEVPDGAENVPAESLNTLPDTASKGAVSDSLR